MSETTETPTGGSLFDSMYGSSAADAEAAEVAAANEYETAAEQVREGRQAAQADDDYADFLKASADDLEQSGYDVEGDPDLNAALTGPEAERYWQERAARQQAVVQELEDSIVLLEHALNALNQRQDEAQSLDPLSRHESVDTRALAAISEVALTGAHGPDSDPHALLNDVALHNHHG